MVVHTYTFQLMICGNTTGNSEGAFALYPARVTANVFLDFNRACYEDGPSIRENGT